MRKQINPENYSLSYIYLIPQEMIYFGFGTDWIRILVIIFLDEIQSGYCLGENMILDKVALGSI